MRNRVNNCASLSTAAFNEKKNWKTHRNEMPVWRHRCSVNDRTQSSTTNGKRQLANCRPSVLALIFHGKRRWIRQHAPRCVASTVCVASRGNCLANEYVGMYFAGAQNLLPKHRRCCCWFYSLFSQRTDDTECAMKWKNFRFENHRAVEFACCRSSGQTTTMTATKCEKKKKQNANRIIY